MKRYLYIIIAIIVIAAVAIGVLLYIKNNSSNNSGGVTTGTTTGGALPVVGTQGSVNLSSTGSPLSLSSVSGSSTAPSQPQSSAPSFGVLSSNPVAAYFVNAQNVITAIQPDGQVFTVINGQSSIISSTTIYGLISAGFSSDGMKAFINYGDPNNPQTEVYNATSNTWVALPAGMQSPQWSPATGSYTIAYLAPTQSGALSLQTIDATGAASIKRGPSPLVTLAATDLTLQWPMNNYFILSDKPTSQNNGSIWEFNASTRTFVSLVSGVPGAESIWSNNTAAPYGIVFGESGPANQLTDNLRLQPLYGNAPSEQLDLLTLPSKCVFDNETMPIVASTTTATSTPKTRSASVKAPTSTPYLALYCGVPRDSSGFSSANLPDDYNMMSLFTSDDIYKINMTTAAITPIWADQTQNMDVSDAKVFNGTLFFVNRYDQKLYGLTDAASQ